MFHDSLRDHVMQSTRNLVDLEIVLSRGVDPDKLRKASVLTEYCSQTSSSTKFNDTSYVVDGLIYFENVKK